MLYPYGICMVVGVSITLCAIWNNFQRKRAGIESYETLIELALLLIGAAFVGGRIFYYLFHADVDESIWKFWEGGFAITGSVCCASMCLAGYSYVKKRNVLVLFDLISTGAPLMHMWGRLGCLLGGCCGGTVCVGQVFIPVQIMCVLWYALIYAVLRYHASALRVGTATITYLASICIERFMSEFVREDAMYVGGVVSSYQLASLLCLVILYTLWKTYISPSPDKRKE